MNKKAKYAGSILIRRNQNIAAWEMYIQFIVFED